jgi:TolB-like protein/tetratricopeptide (TPR) repeat protein
MSLTLGARIGPYEVAALIGAGGMGEVYRAHDTRLGRDVAVKILPGAFTSDPDRLARFEREARVLAALNHPNIAAIYGLEESEGVRGLVMELVEGPSLADVLAGARAPDSDQARGPTPRITGLPIADTLRIAKQVAEALEAAHAKGITHRDIKPANIKITREGRAKVLDFGLAKAVQGERQGSEFSPTATASLATAPGQILGTPPYMSPEQTRGQAVDQSSDIWAFGCLLFELLSGRRAFSGATLPDVIGAVINRDPDWSALPAATPERLRGLVRRCLEKDPARRLSSIGEARAAIEQVQAGHRGVRRRTVVAATVAALAVAISLPVAFNLGGVRDRLEGMFGGQRIHAIAVLPLRNASGNPAQEYFADGMTESLIESLAKIGEIRVIARTSVMRYKGTDTPLPDIARALHVDAVVEGSATREGSQVRMVASLVNPMTQTTIWSDEYVQPAVDVLILQSRIARAIAQQIGARLTPAEEQRLADVRRVDPEAHDLYIQGMSHLTRLTPPELNTALKYFELARGKEPALGWAGIAMVWQARLSFGLLPAKEAGPPAEAAALEALKHDDTLPEAHLVVGLARMRVDWDWAGARREFDRALELSPNDAEIHAQYARLEAVMGNSTRAVELGAKAVSLDPLRPIFQGMQGLNLVNAGRYQEAIVLLHQMQRQQPGVRAEKFLAMAFYGLGDYESMYRQWRALFEARGDAQVLHALDPAYASGGYRTALRAGARTLAARTPRAESDSALIVQMYAEAGDPGQALQWLESMQTERNPSLPGTTTGPEMTDLRRDPRFQAVRQRIGLPPL